MAAQLYTASDETQKAIVERFRKLYDEYQTKGKADWNMAQITQQRAAELACKFLPEDITKYFRPIFNLHIISKD
jgi:hypothetical protein